MKYQIVTAALGSCEDGVILTPRANWSAARLERNLTCYWAWNIRGQFGYESDGPCVFIEWENK